MAERQTDGAGAGAGAGCREKNPETWATRCKAGAQSQDRIAEEKTWGGEIGEGKAAGGKAGS